MKTLEAPAPVPAQEKRCTRKQATNIANALWKERNGGQLALDKPFQPKVTLMLAIRLLEASGMSPEDATKQTIIAQMMEGTPKTLAAMRKRFAQTSLHIAKMSKSELALNPGCGPYVLYNNNPETPVIRTGTLAELLQDVDSGDVPFIVYKHKEHTKAEIEEMFEKGVIDCAGVMQPAVFICREVMYDDAEVGTVTPRDDSDPDYIVPAIIHCSDCADDHMFLTCESCVEKLRVARLKLKEPHAACHLCKHPLGIFLTQPAETRDDKKELPPTKLTGRLVRVYTEGNKDYEYRIACDMCRACLMGVDFPIKDDTKEIPVWRFAKSTGKLQIGNDDVADVTDREDLLASTIK